MVFLEATNIDAFELQQNFFNTRKYFVLWAQIFIQQAFQQNLFSQFLESYTNQSII
jgi:hypothetical protein